MTGSPVFLAVVLSLISAICYAAAAVVQERTAAGTTSLRGALARGAWWGSVLLNASGALLHVVALRYGPLTLVQPLGALSLVLAVPLGSLVSGRRTSGTQWSGMAFTLMGLTTLLAVTASGRGDTLSTPQVLLVALAAGLAVAVLSARSGLAVAAASGIASGVGSTLAQKLAVGPTLSWSTGLVALLTVAFAVGGLLLSQKAYRHGLGGPLALLTLVNPVTAAAIGITLLGEGFRYGTTGTLLALAGAAAAVHGVTLLSRPEPTPTAGQTKPTRAALSGTPEAEQGANRARPPRLTVLGRSAAGQDIGRLRSARPALLGGSAAGQGVGRMRRARPVRGGGSGADGRGVDRVGLVRPVLVGGSGVGQDTDPVGPVRSALVGRSVAGQEADRVAPVRTALVGRSEAAAQGAGPVGPPRPVLLGSPHLEQDSGQARPTLPVPVPPVRTEPLRPLPVSVQLTGASRAV